MRMGCDQIEGSLARLDACDVCGGDGKTCIGCDGVKNSGKMINYAYEGRNF